MSFQDAVQTLRTADAQLNRLEPQPFPVPCTGLEAVIAGAVLALGRGDWWVPGLRERVGGVLRNAPVERLVDASRGAAPYKIAPATASPSLRALYAVGLAEGCPDRTTLVHLGVGSTSDGAFHEALNLAALRRPNVVFLIAIHPLEGEAPLGPQIGADLLTLGTSFALPVHTVDGNDVHAVHTAVTTAKSATGPQIILATLNPAEDVVQRTVNLPN